MAAIFLTTFSNRFSSMKIVCILIQISLKFVPKGSINNSPALVPIMAWRRPGDKPLSEPMVVRSPTHICVTRPQWVNRIFVNITLLFESRHNTMIHGIVFECVFLFIQLFSVIVTPTDTIHFTALLFSLVVIKFASMASRKTGLP